MDTSWHTPHGLSVRSGVSTLSLQQAVTVSTALDFDFKPGGRDLN